LSNNAGAAVTCCTLAQFRQSERCLFARQPVGLFDSLSVVRRILFLFYTRPVSVLYLSTLTCLVFYTFKNSQNLQTHRTYVSLYSLLPESDFSSASRHRLGHSFDLCQSS
jgi:sterol desaturase/sphingolipid hydroxylase (fatty acid hydroxylase superfamily)